MRLWVRIPRKAWMFVVSVVCCQVEVSATGLSLVQRRPTDCGAPKQCDLETSRMRRVWPTLGRSAAKCVLFKFPPSYKPISSTILMATLGTANETHKPLVTSETLFKTFLYIYFIVQWPYSTCKVRIATIMIGSASSTRQTDQNKWPG